VSLGSRVVIGSHTLSLSRSTTCFALLWVLPGCWIASNLDNMNNQSALTESVSKNNDQKQVKAKQIFLGIDAHLKSNQVAWRVTLRLAHTSSRYRSTTCIALPLACFAYRSGYLNVAGSSQTQRG
jgi:hypothetical protein